MMDNFDWGSIAEMLAPVIMAIFGWVSVRIAAWVKAHTKNTMIKGTLLRLNESILTLVREAEQTAVAELKKARSPDSPGGEKLTPEEAKEIKEKVTGNFKSLWGQRGLDELTRVLGFSNGESVEKFLGSKIEEAVYKDKHGIE
jgi:hypothetical protein